MTKINLLNATNSNYYSNYQQSADKKEISMGANRQEVNEEPKKTNAPYGPKIDTYEMGDHIIKNSFANRTKIKTEKLVNAFTVYPAKGLSGDKNSNFYEFLTMGTVPYLTGSLMLMLPYALISKFAKTDAKGAKFAKGVLGPMAIGVLLFGVLKEVSKKFISQPVKWATGVDVNLPYKKVVRELPKTSDGKAKVSNEYHKVFESVDFPRMDLLYEDKTYGDKYGSYFDHIASKNGLGEDLVASDQVVKPFVKKLVTKERTNETISSYLWAALGVGLACTQTIKNLFTKTPESKSFKQIFTLNNLKDTAKKAWNTISGSVGDLHGGLVGKVLIYGALASTVIGIVNTLSNNKPKKEDKTVNIDYSKDYTVN